MRIACSATPEGEGAMCAAIRRPTSSLGPKVTSERARGEEGGPLVSRRSFLAGLGGATALALVPTSASRAAALALASTSDSRAVAAQPAADPSVINDWNATAVNVIATDAATGAAEAMLYIGFVQAAVYNAVNGITGRYELYKSNARPAATASPQAAAVAAAHRVLMTYYGHVPAAVTRLTDAY